MCSRSWAVCRRTAAAKRSSPVCSAAQNSRGMFIRLSMIVRPRCAGSERSPQAWMMPAGSRKRRMRWSAASSAALASIRRRRAVATARPTTACTGSPGRGSPGLRPHDAAAKSARARAAASRKSVVTGEFLREPLHPGPKLVVQPLLAPSADAVGRGAQRVPIVQGRVVRIALAECRDVRDARVGSAAAIAASRSTADVLLRQKRWSVISGDVFRRGDGARSVMRQRRSLGRAPAEGCSGVRPHEIQRGGRREAERDRGQSS